MQMELIEIDSNPTTTDIVDGDIDLGNGDNSVNKSGLSLENSAPNSNQPIINDINRLDVDSTMYTKILTLFDGALHDISLLCPS